ncbi:MAG: general stress protein [Deltaproteobacteria bacterium]|nr:general stress protein [Deltaproteobacteria bacterium]MDQ3298362.1 general stress protein [Myxococcota bacterium]
MGTKKKTVQVGVFDEADDARTAIRELRDAGYSDKEIGLLSHDRQGNAEVTTFKDLEGNKAGTGAAIGAAAGAGGGALWAIGIAAGLLPAIGPVIAGGILAALAASAGAGAAAGLVVGAFMGLGVSDEEAAYYDAEFGKGRTIVVVQSDRTPDTAYRILHERRSQNPYLRDPLMPVEDSRTQV